MQVILLEDIRKVGKKGDTVTLKDGYVRNLISKKQAAEFAQPSGKILEQVKKEKRHARDKQTESIRERSFLRYPR